MDEDATTTDALIGEPGEALGANDHSTIEPQSPPHASWVHWTTVWANLDGIRTLIWVPRYGGPMDSPLSGIGARLVASGKIDPSLL